jgi:hypothetical protein
MQLAIHSRYRRWLEVVLPMYSLAVLLGYFRPHAVPFLGAAGTSDSLVPWALWGLVGAMSGVLALSGLVVAFFLLYSPLYLLARSWMLVGKGGWVDRRELRFYLACFILLCFLAGLAIVNPVAAASTFVLIAGSAHLLWRALA